MVEDPHAYVREAAWRKWVKGKYTNPLTDPTGGECFVGGFNAGIGWQREQDQALLVELAEALYLCSASAAGMTVKVQAALTKCRDNGLLSQLPS